MRVLYPLLSEPTQAIAKDDTTNVAIIYSKGRTKSLLTNPEMSILITKSAFIGMNTFLGLSDFPKKKIDRKNTAIRCNGNKNKCSPYTIEPMTIYENSIATNCITLILDDFTNTTNSI